MKTITRLEVLQAIEKIISAGLTLNLKEIKETHEQAAVIISKNILTAMAGAQLLNISETQKKYLNFQDEEKIVHEKILSATKETDTSEVIKHFLQKISLALTHALKAYHVFSTTNPAQDHLVRFCEIMCTPQLICRAEIPKLIFEPTLNLESFIPYIALNFLHMDLQSLILKIYSGELPVDKDSENQLISLRGLFDKPVTESKPIIFLDLALKNLTSPTPYITKLLSKHTHVLFSKEIFDFYQYLFPEIKQQQGAAEPDWGSMNNIIALSALLEKLEKDYQGKMEKTQFSASQLASIPPKSSHLSMTEYLKPLALGPHIKEYLSALKLMREHFATLKEIAMCAHSLMTTEQEALLINFLDRVFPVKAYKEAIEKEKIPTLPLASVGVGQLRSFLESEAQMRSISVTSGDYKNTSSLFTPTKAPPPLPLNRTPRSKSVIVTSRTPQSGHIIPKPSPPPVPRSNTGLSRENKTEPVVEAEKYTLYLARSFSEKACEEIKDQHFIIYIPSSQLAYVIENGAIKNPSMVRNVHFVAPLPELAGSGTPQKYPSSDKPKAEEVLARIKTIKDALEKRKLPAITTPNPSSTSEEEAIMKKAAEQLKQDELEEKKLAATKTIQKTFAIAISTAISLAINQSQTEQPESLGTPIPLETTSSFFTAGCGFVCLPATSSSFTPDTLRSMSLTFPTKATYVYIVDRKNGNQLVYVSDVKTSKISVPCKIESGTPIEFETALKKVLGDPLPTVPVKLTSEQQQTITYFTGHPPARRRTSQIVIPAHVTKAISLSATPKKP